MVQISWNAEKGYWGTWDTGLCTWGGNAAGVGGLLSAWLCRIVGLFMFSFQFDCGLTILLFIFGQLFFFSFFFLFVTRLKCCQEPAADQRPKYTWHHPEHLRKANRIWQKTGWNRKCSNLLKATGRGNNSWPQSVNKPNVFTSQHRRWKGRRKKETLEVLPQ